MVIYVLITAISVSNFKFVCNFFFPSKNVVL